MSSHRRKAELDAMRDAEIRLHALTTGRHFDDTINYPGAGTPLVRLTFLPSFDTPMLWEVRERAGRLMAYSSRGVAPGSPHVVGHDVLPVPEDVLRTTVARLNSLSFSVSPRTPAVGVADADVYVATIYCGFETACRLSWCAGAAPAEWSDAIAILLLLRSVLERDGKAS